jgi:hypothetical protein
MERQRDVLLENRQILPKLQYYVERRCSYMPKRQDPVYSISSNSQKSGQRFLCSKRASLCLSRRKNAAAKGVITVEAALAVPLFFLAALALFYMLEVMSIRTAIRSGMQYAAKMAAEDIYVYPKVTPGSLEADIVSAVGGERLERSIVVGGSGGIHCEKSRMSAITGILELKAAYQVRLPIPVFAAAPVNMTESMRMKGWNGYVRSGFGQEDEEMVYITETGMVYHQDYHCNYLELSIRMVPYSQVDGLRNESHGKYHACEGCVHGGAADGVYITDYGDRYHNSLSCSGLKRTIYAVPLSEAVGKGACSKCCR